MDYEKKYKEAFKEAEKIHKFSSDIAEIKRMEQIFPELVESEDEKIRKRIIHALHGDVLEMSEIKEALAWLEKQESVGEIVSRCKTSWYNEGKIRGQIEGLSEEEKYQQGWHDALKKQSKQKSADKVEPKFKVGDWVVCEVTGSIYQIKNCIENLSNHKYGYDLTNGGYIGSDEVNHYHLWTITDAKDGDVLVSQYNKPFIYNGNYNSFHVGAYCGISVEDSFKVSTEKCYWTENVNIHPATKGQRDLLFAKMKEEGYEWNEEKKELKRVSQRMISAEVKEAMYAKPAWSEEDKSKVQRICRYLNEAKKYYADIFEVRECMDWLKSLKDRVQPKQEWNEEDKITRETLVNIVNAHYEDCFGSTEKCLLLNWLKYLERRISCD